MVTSYRGNDYIVSAEPIAEGILKNAIQNLGERIADQQTEDRNRSTSLSYAKDMVVAGTIPLNQLYDRATENYKFIKGMK